LEPRGLFRHGGIVLVLALSFLVLGVRSRAQDRWVERYDQYFVHGFDGYVYLAMSEDPRVFTLAPWGYRVLGPWIVHAVARAGAVDAFRGLGFLSLLLAAACLFLWLRRLGHGELLSTLAAVAFLLMPPVDTILRYPLLTEPLAILIEMAFLLVLESGANGPLLALLLALGALSKESLLALSPLVYLEARVHAGHGRGLARMLAVSAPAIVLTLGLRSSWGRALPAETFAFDLDDLPGKVSQVAGTAATWGPPALLFGLTPLAALGALRRAARAFLLRYGYLILAYGALPFLGGFLMIFFADDVSRLILYVVPLLLGLASIAVDRVWPHLRPPPSRPSARPRHRLMVAAATLAVVAAPLALADRYRRMDLSGPRDGPFILTFCRETGAVSRDLEVGATVTFRLAEQVYERRERPDEGVQRMRWFLREGWGRSPQYGTALPAIEGQQASLVVPVRHVQDVEVRLGLQPGHGDTAARPGQRPARHGGAAGAGDAGGAGRPARESAVPRRQRAAAGRPGTATAGASARHDLVDGDILAPLRCDCAMTRVCHRSPREVFR
jgi:hypothetical protein